MKTRHRSHPVAPYIASTPRSPAPMGKRNPTGTRMGIKGSDPALYNHNGDIIDTKAIQAEVVRKTQENIAAKAAASPVVSDANSVSDIGAQPHTAEARPIKDVLQDFKRDYGKLPWFRGAGIATGNRLRLMVDGKYKGETPETYKGFGIELVMVDHARDREASPSSSSSSRWSSSPSSWRSSGAAAGSPVGERESPPARPTQRPTRGSTPGSSWAPRTPWSPAWGRTRT